MERKKPNVKCFHVFGSKCYIFIDQEQMHKIDPKSDKGIFLGYSINSGTYRVHNNRTKTITGSINVVIYDVPQIKTSDEKEDYLHINE